MPTPLFNDPMISGSNQSIPINPSARGARNKNENRIKDARITTTTISAVSGFVAVVNFEFSI
jgi:hypothetical protein